MYFNLGNILNQSWGLLGFRVTRRRDLFNGSLSDSVVEDVWDICKIDGPVLGTLECWVGTRPISVERYLRNSRLTDGMSTPWCWVEDIWDFQDWWLEPGRLGALSFNTTEMLILEDD